ncbi:glycerol-3-phosphate acyltransferase [Allobaculum sp. JKK-2023]|uniref:glycerol-3-phosphate acyltransferase n=1 Tax=Allobaculum sp. JKK-2023 TaxID=3108943 RepID=UPI002B051D1A|nr:glycerol-3-phosphate acyltransferase [Allobaculum sp. JKK-2023]
MIKILIFYILLGYLCGSILFFHLYGRFFAHRDMAAQAADHNPGVFDAFRYGGFQAGLFVLIGDLAKGFLPVGIYLLQAPDPLNYGLGLVMAAPILGHDFSIFSHFRGGKGITTTFGVLAALWAGGLGFWPLGTFAILFLLFKGIIQVSPDYYLTILVYLLCPAISFLEPVNLFVRYGLLLISGVVLVRMALSKEIKNRLEVKLVWKH